MQENAGIYRKRPLCGLTGGWVHVRERKVQASKEPAGLKLFFVAMFWPYIDSACSLFCTENLISSIIQEDVHYITD